MTVTRLVLLLSWAEAPQDPPAGKTEPPQSASPGGRWRYLTHLEASGPALLFPEGMGALRPGAFASMGLGVDHAR
ncbi:hypothetical protein [Archangium violaceum]|uniref:hypothetical protein n=1 Tax=Archangium violaceum TaxID=83451 RepID=UPI001269E5BB|nr:hypothetical protein [Archangium violaceum]